jgi:hypothetical protein
MNKQISDGITCESKTIPEIKEGEKEPTMSNITKIQPEVISASRDPIPGSSSQNQVPDALDNLSKISKEAQLPSNAFTSETQKSTFPLSTVSKNNDM